jgi:hypothetical protein
MATDLCPWLGTAADTEVRHADPSDVHVCYAQRRPEEIALDYQARFCLVSEHRTCTFYREPPAPSAPVAPKTEADEVGLPRRHFRWWLLALCVVSVALAAVAIYVYLPLQRKPESSSATSATLSAASAIAPTVAGLPAPSATAIELAQAAATPTSYPGGAIDSLAPDASAPSGTPRYVVVTSTATPGNVLTAAAMLRTATAIALTTGQPAPGSVVLVTATPMIVVTGVPTAANHATAEYERAMATAIAMTTGTFTPTPLNLVTATPTSATLPPASATPSGTPPSGATASATPSSTPTPRATASATLSSTPTLRATARATASSTPTARATASVAPPSTTPRPASATPTLPAELQNKILFRSDRLPSPNPWVMNADGTGAAMLADGSPYEAAKTLESLSPDGSQRVFVGTVDGMPAILIAPTRGGQGRPLVAFRDAQLSSPVWSPAGSRIAFVSSWSGGAQIWLISTNGSGLRELTYESWGLASHPTFSPDGSRVAYASASSPGSRQIWLIGIDGAGRRNLSNNGYDDWDPVWVK